VTRVAPGRIYGDKVQGARTVDVGNTADINTEIGNVSVRVSDGGFVTVESPMLVRLMVNDKSGAAPRELEMVDMKTGGQGLAVMLRDGDEVGLGLDRSGRPLERLKVKYTSNGVKICHGSLKCVEVKEGQRAVIGRGALGMDSQYISREHIEVEVRREYVNGRLQPVAWVRDLGSANGSAVYSKDGVYILYTGRADEKGPVAGIQPKSYGIRTPHEVDAFVGNIKLRLPHAAPATKQTAAALKV